VFNFENCGLNMEASYFPEFPKDDYALAVLTQAAAIHESSDQDANTTRKSNKRPSAGDPLDRLSTSGNNSTDSKESNTLLINQRQVNGQRINSRPEQDGSENLLGGGHKLAERGMTFGNLRDNMHNSRVMGDLSFNPLIGQHGQHFAHGGYDGIGGQMSQDFGILSAETYDDGRGNLRSKGSAVNSRKPRDEMPFGMVDRHALGEAGSEEHDNNRRSRKKQRVESDDDEARKKARGRPRVDTRDETAADVCGRITPIGQVY